MELVLIIFFSLCLFYFFYESILLPSLRYFFRLKLFKYRDKLRQLKIENSECVPDNTFMYIQHTINNSIRFLHDFHISTVAESRKYLEKNHKAEKEIEKRVEEIKNTDKQIQQVFSKSIRIVVLALVANSGMWLIYFIPLIIPIVVYDKLKELTIKIVSMPSNSLENIKKTNPAYIG